jgi:chromosome segregation ATPase
MNEYQQQIAAESSEDAARHDELYQARQRIEQLERLNATLAAHVDRQAKVVEAVFEAFNRGGGFTEQLAAACDDYVTAMAQLAKGEQHGAG